MKFKVISPSRHVPLERVETFVLMQDNWNDYGFQTQYHLFVVDSKQSTRIGAVKILRGGQTAQDNIQIAKDFTNLGDKFVSVGQELDYYHRLTELGIEKRRAILLALRDVVALPELRKQFEKEEGWKTSLFRDQQTESINDFLRLAEAIVEGNYTELAGEGLRFSLHLPGWMTPVAFNFAPTEEPEPFTSATSTLPERVFVLIGRNGSGKTTLLARLARIAYSSATNRIDGLLDHLGTISPVGIGFPRIVAVSYSAFDSFALPGLAPQTSKEPDEREQIVRESRTGAGRYIYCGLRDVATELQQAIDAGRSRDSDLASSGDSVDRTILKSVGTLADEWTRACERASTLNRSVVLAQVLDTLFVDSAFAGSPSGLEIVSGKSEDRRALFLSWSTGQKIATQIVANLVAYIMPQSLVLIDEPEMHLHPPVLARLMHVVRRILETYKAFAIIATHSPVVLQETMARHIFVVRREGGTFNSSLPSIETFGENVGTITHESFGLDCDVTDYHSVLDKLIQEHTQLESIEGLFEPHGLSRQARAYVMSRIAQGK
jgi:ABC-type cobalamin/Fe3+-siderophores transport system ATPase subunit